MEGEPVYKRKIILYKKNILENWGRFKRDKKKFLWENHAIANEIIRKKLV